MQQILVFVIIAIAGLYLARSFWRSAHAFFSKQGGCTSGCGKCSFAPLNARKPGEAKAARHSTVIPLTKR